ncbi:SLBP family of RNA binding protein [Cryptosporidium tyzzeri]|nr:SLBP family of RNA binding protein [Cryptosporidium tyzzeri]
MINLDNNAPLSCNPMTSHRVYEISILLLIGKKVKEKNFVSAIEVHPNLPKLEAKESEAKNLNPSSKYIQSKNSLFTLDSKNFDIYNEVDPPPNKGFFSFSDLTSLLEKLPSTELIKYGNYKSDFVRQNTELKASEEPLTSRMVSRLKQIAIGKSLPEYKNYINQVPLEKRSSEDPRTPKCDTRLTKREFDNLYREWRVKLHQYESKFSSGASTRVNTPEDDLKHHSRYCPDIKTLKI